MWGHTHNLAFVSSPLTRVECSPSVQVRKSSLIGLINWSHVMSTFSPYFLMVASTLFMAQLAYNYAFLPNPVKSEFFKVMEDAIEEPSIFTAAVKVNAIAVLVVWYFAR